jgi:hypothetical protein
MPGKFKTPSAVIIIDAWLGPVGHRPHTMLKNLTKFIQQDFVKCIVVVSYLEYTRHGTSATPIESPIWHNSRQVFNPDLNPAVPAYTGSAWLAQERKQIISDDYTGPVVNQFILHDTPVTNPAVLNMSLRSDQKMFAAWTLDQLVYLINSQYPDVEHIYLCGGAFEHCLKDRPIGLTSLMSAMSLEQFDTVQHLLIPVNCVYTSSGPLLNTRPDLIDPGWYYNQAQEWIHVQGRALREPTISKDVLAALNLEPMDKQQSCTVQIDNQQAALSWARLETKKRRGLL